MNDIQFGDIIASLLEDVAKQDGERRKQQVINEIQRLYSIYTLLQKIQIEGQSVFKNQEISRRSQLWYILGTSQEKSLAARMELLTQKENLRQVQEELIPLLLESYELTSKILQDLNIIRDVKVVMTGRIGTGFIREENFQIQPTDLILELHRGRLALRFRESAVKSRLLQFTNAEEISETDVSIHYREFVADLQQTAKKPNWGIVSEAFERHWEQLQHLNMNSSTAKIHDWGSEGDAWQLYHLSSGSSAYYTGPDTEFAQVKSINASLVSNINTILQTVQAIITLVETKVINKSGIEYVKEQYLKAFAPKRERLTKQGAELIQATVQQLIQQNFKI